MALHFFPNTFPADSTGTLPDLTTRLIATGGWTCMASGDGVSNYSSNGATNYFTTGAVAASSGTQFPWIRLKFPGSTRELCISKRNDGAGQPGRAFRIKYSYASQFVGGPRINGVITGSIGANGVPSAADEGVILGNPATNDDTSNASGEVMFTPTGTYIYHLAIDDASAAFWLVGHYNQANGGPRTTAVFMLDPTTGTNPADNDPYVFYASNIGGNITAFPLAADSNLVALHAANGQGPMARYRAGLPNAVFDYCYAAGLWAYNSTLASRVMVIPRNLGTNPRSGAEDMYPVRYYGQDLAAAGTAYGAHWKGFSTLMKWKSTNRATGVLNSTRTKVVFDDVWLDWDGASAVRIA